LDEHGSGIDDALRRENTNQRAAVFCPVSVEFVSDEIDKLY